MLEEWMRLSSRSVNWRSSRDWDCLRDGIHGILPGGDFGRSGRPSRKKANCPTDTFRSFPPQKWRKGRRGNLESGAQRASPLRRAAKAGLPHRFSKTLSAALMSSICAGLSSPSLRVIGTEGLLPFCGLGFRCEQSLRESGYLEGQTLSEFDLSQQHVEGISRFHSKPGENLLRIAQSAGGNACAEK